MNSLWVLWIWNKFTVLASKNHHELNKIWISFNCLFDYGSMLRIKCAAFHKNFMLAFVVVSVITYLIGFIYVHNFVFFGFVSNLYFLHIHEASEWIANTKGDKNYKLNKNSSFASVLNIKFKFFCDLFRILWLCFAPGSISLEAQSS